MTISISLPARAEFGGVFLFDLIHRSVELHLLHNDILLLESDQIRLPTLKAEVRTKDGEGLQERRRAVFKY